MCIRDRYSIIDLELNCKDSFFTVTDDDKNPKFVSGLVTHSQDLFCSYEKKTCLYKLV